jgi:hypothetical protein
LLSTAYPLPFVFEIPADNPWDGARAVDLYVKAASPLTPSQAKALGSFLQPFWILGAAGGLAGEAIPPWNSLCSLPLLSTHSHAVRFAFGPSLLDERASSCLLALLLAAHDEVPLQSVQLIAPGGAVKPILFDAKQQEPYPRPYPELPFPYEVEDSESETRVLRVQFQVALSEAQLAEVKGRLHAWGHAAEWGAFPLAPLPPRSSACLANAPIEHYEGELLWGIEKCRFHASALDSLVGVCAAIHHAIAPIAELSVE